MSAIRGAPGWCAVPDVLHGGVVVHAESEGRALREEGAMGREAEIGVVDPQLTALGSNVTCRKPPTCGVISPPVNRLNWSGNSTVPFCVPGSAFFVLVYDVWNINDTGATRLSSRLC